jgi:hypothetical protein
VALPTSANLEQEVTVPSITTAGHLEQDVTIDSILRDSHFGQEFGMTVTAESHLQQDFTALFAGAGILSQEFDVSMHSNLGQEFRIPMAYTPDVATARTGEVHQVETAPTVVLSGLNLSGESVGQPPRIGHQHLTISFTTLSPTRHIGPIEIYYRLNGGAEVIWSHNQWARGAKTHTFALGQRLVSGDSITYGVRAYTEETPGNVIHFVPFYPVDVEVESYFTLEGKAVLPAVTTYHSFGANNLGRIIVWRDDGDGKLAGTCVTIDEDEIQFTTNSRIETMKSSEIDSHMFDVDELPLNGLTLLRDSAKNNIERVTMILVSGVL